MLQPDQKTKFLKFNAALIIGFLMLTFCFDFLDKIEIFYDIDFFKFNKYLKLIILIYAVGFIMYQLSYVFKQLKYLIVTVSILSIIFLQKYQYWSVYKDEFLRYIVILILFPVLHFTYAKSKDYNLMEGFYRLMKVFVIINIVAILLGLIFDIEVFKTYQWGRFGYNGILLSQGVTPYVYLSAAVIFWARKNHWMLGAVIFASAISGIKGIYLGLFMLLGLLIWYDKRLTKALKTKLILCCFILFSLLLVVIFTTETFREVIESDGIMSAIFSYRLDNLYELIEESSSADFSFIIGAIGLATVRLELQLVDVVLFFGILGVITYVYFFTFLFKDIVKNSASKALFYATLLLSLLSGNLLYIPLSMTLFLLTLLVLNIFTADSEKNLN